MQLVVCQSEFFVFCRVVVVVMRITLALQSFKFQPLTACRNNNNNINKNQVLIYSQLGALPTIIISQTKNDVNCVVLILCSALFVSMALV